MGYGGFLSVRGIRTRQEPRVNLGTLGEAVVGGGTAQDMADSSHRDSPVSHMMTVLTSPLPFKDNHFR